MHEYTIYWEDDTEEDIYANSLEEANRKADRMSEECEQQYIDVVEII